MTGKKALDYAVSFTTPEYGQRILGKITIPDEGMVELNARDKTLEILYANGLEHEEIVQTNGTFAQIELTNGTIITIHSLPPFEKFARAAVPKRT